MFKLLNSAAYRIAFTYSAAFALTMVPLGVAVYCAADDDFKRQESTHITEETAALLREFQQDGRAGLSDAIGEREVGNTITNLGYALFDAAGRRIAGGLNTPRPPPGWHDIVFEDPHEGSDAARALATDLPDGTRLVVAVDREGLERIDATILSLFSMALVLVLLIGLVGALLLGAYLRRRLSDISGTARIIMAGDLARRMPVSARRDEFDQLSVTLNAMLDRIAALLDNLRQVSSDVAHDLRTPLARLRNQLERALGDTGHSRAALEQAIVQSDELLALFAAILRISEVEGGALGRAFERIDLSQLMTDLGESYAPAVADGDRTLECAIAPHVVVNGDHELLVQAVINLLDNAQRYTPPKTRILLRLAIDDGNTRLTVADNGPGVASADQERMVRRFARLEASRSTPGHGLGLNLVAAIATIHHAELLIEGNAPGLRVSLLWARIPP